MLSCCCCVVVARGKRLIQQARIYDTIEEAHEGTWVAHTYQRLFNDFLKYHHPKPTVLVLNQNYQTITRTTTTSSSSIMNDIHNIMKSALELVDIVIWQRGTPTTNDIKKMYFDYAPIDLYVKDVVCNKDHDKSVQVIKNDVVHFCVFVDFPDNILKKLYLGGKKFFTDSRRFSDNSVYLGFNDATMEAINKLRGSRVIHSNNNKKEKDKKMIMSSNKPQQDHLVYIGDALLRYQYLTFVYVLQHQQLPSKNLTYPGRASWKHYFDQSTSDIGKGNMLCDCYRKIGRPLVESHENRYYHHPNGHLFLSYIQKFGDHPGECCLILLSH